MNPLLSVRLIADCSDSIKRITLIPLNDPGFVARILPRLTRDLLLPYSRASTRDLLLANRILTKGSRIGVRDEE